MIGTYILVVSLTKDSLIRVGRLGIIWFKKGYYCYVGSAFGKSVNIENRIERHLRLNFSKDGVLRWHIDYFLVNPFACIIKVFVFNGVRIECEISKVISFFAKKSVKDFGSSDCKCFSHFHYLGRKIEFEKFVDYLKGYDGLNFSEISL